MNTIEEFQPLADQVVVEPLRQLERFSAMSGSLYIPDNPTRDKQHEFYHLGRVIKTGPGDAVREGRVRPDGSRAAYACPDGRWPVHVCPGDIVLYERRPTAVIILGDRQYLVIHEEQHIAAVVDLPGESLTAPAYDPKVGELVT